MNAARVVVLLAAAGLGTRGVQSALDADRLAPERWTLPVPAQGGELSSASCAACHAAQFSDWSRTRHALAMGPGVWAQMNARPN